MRILVAPDKFRGTLSAQQAAEAIELGWRRVRPDDDLDLVPMADGGEGTLAAMVAAGEGTTRTIPVTGPLGDPVEAPLGLVDDGRRLAVVECASASGLAYRQEAAVARGCRSSCAKISSMVLDVRTISLYGMGSGAP